MCCHTKFRIPTPCHTSSTPSVPLMCDVIYGCPLREKGQNIFFSQMYVLTIAISKEIRSNTVIKTELCIT